MQNESTHSKFELQRTKLGVFWPIKVSFGWIESSLYGTLMPTIIAATQSYRATTSSTGPERPDKDPARPRTDPAVEVGKQKGKKERNQSRKTNALKQKIPKTHTNQGM